MPEQNQLPEIASIDVEWLQDNQFGRKWEISTFYTDNPRIPLFISGNYFQIFHNDRWPTFWKGFKYKNMKRNYK
jgi:hypothetical protein